MNFTSTTNKSKIFIYLIIAGAAFYAGYKVQALQAAKEDKPVTDD